MRGAESGPRKQAQQTELRDKIPPAEGRVTGESLDPEGPPGQGVGHREQKVAGTRVQGSPHSIMVPAAWEEQVRESNR